MASPTGTPYRSPGEKPKPGVGEINQRPQAQRPDLQGPRTSGLPRPTRGQRRDPCREAGRRGEDGPGDRPRPETARAGEHPGGASLAPGRPGRFPAAPARASAHLAACAPRCGASSQCSSDAAAERGARGASAALAHRAETRRLRAQQGLPAAALLPRPPPAAKRAGPARGTASRTVAAPGASEPGARGVARHSPAPLAPRRPPRRPRARHARPHRAARRLL